eukprot:4608858-Prymnesium_polylepis.2
MLDGAFHVSEPEGYTALTSRKVCEAAAQQASSDAADDAFDLLAAPSGGRPAPVGAAARRAAVARAAPLRRGAALGEG